MPNISVIICTRNRCDSLSRTLAAFQNVRLPSGSSAEIVVVDNGSTDDTPSVVKAADTGDCACRLLSEDKSGQSRARNTGIRAAVGEAIVFTDDDVLPASDWLENLTEPLFERRYDAVVGWIDLASSLVRPWMTVQHKRWLAAPEDDGAHLELVGANMAFHRDVLLRVPGFDPDLGPGMLGFGDDSLFSLQLERAGFKVGHVRSAKVVHVPDSCRLLRSEWLRAARQRGETAAYLTHHWYHESSHAPLLKSLYFNAKLGLRRALHRVPSKDREGCELWEISYVANAARFSRFIRERGKPRNYTRFGLFRLDAQPPKANWGELPSRGYLPHCA